MPMGSQLDSMTKPGLAVNRHISGYVAGTAPLATVELIRNGQVLTTFETDGHFIDFVYDDMTPLAEVAIDAGDKNPPFVFYYIRVTQEDGHMAWSSPIWVDQKGVGIKFQNKPAKKEKPVKKTSK